MGMDVPAAYLVGPGTVARSIEVVKSLSMAEASVDIMVPACTC